MEAKLAKEIKWLLCNDTETWKRMLDGDYTKMEFDLNKADYFEIANQLEKLKKNELIALCLSHLSLKDSINEEISNRKEE